MRLISFKSSAILTTLIIFTLQVSSSQTPPRETFNIYFENNFNDNSVGDYTESDHFSDWIEPKSTDRRTETDIVNENNNNFMRGYFPKGCLGPSEGGWHWYAPVSQKTSEIYFSYDVRFKPGFNWVHGGKIPGIIGGRAVSGVKPTFSDGFSVRLMWKGNGSLVYYVYHHDQAGIYGSSYEWAGFQFQAGKWYNLSIRVVLNTVGPNGGEKDGILEGFIDGKLAFQKTNLRFRNLEAIKIDRMYICSYFGGNEDYWRAVRDEWIDTDNYICFNYGDKILNVPRGLHASSKFRNLIHPYLKFSDASWKESINFSTVSESSIRLNWTDYPVPADYVLERRDSNFSGFNKIAKLTYGTRSFTDSGLSPSIVYTYRLTAGESVKELVASTLMVTPTAPTNLRSMGHTGQSVTLTWKDNSNNEESFMLTRTLAIDSLSRIEFIVNKNDTVFTDSNLVSGTSYIYIVKAVNAKGNSSCSNKSMATTLSNEELKRVKEGLIAYYNFGYNPDHIVYDQSGYEDPVNLRILNNEAVIWNENNTMDIHSNTALVSVKAATKIVRAVKESNEITFECWIKPKQPDCIMNSRIVSLAKDNEDVGFLLDQDYAKDENLEAFKYRVRLQTESTVSSGYPEYQPNSMQSHINLQHLVYCRDHMGHELLYLNGEKSSEGFRPSDLCTWRDDYFLRLGNDSDMVHSWKGCYYSVAFYNKALTSEEVNVNYGAGPFDKILRGELNYTFEVFPVPVKTFANLKIIPITITDVIPEMVIRLTDIYGKLLMESTVFNPNSQEVISFDLSAFSSGIYLIEVIAGQVQKIKRIILSR